MSDYSNEPEPEPEPVSDSGANEPAPKKKREGVKMTEKQKADLKKHMMKMEKGGMSKAEMKSHRMKMMARMRKGMSVGKAHKDISK